MPAVVVSFLRSAPTGQGLAGLCSLQALPDLWVIAAGLDQAKHEVVGIIAADGALPSDPD